MRSDALVAFVPIGTPLSCVGGAGVSFRSNIIDLLGVGAGVAPPNIIGTAAVFGTDMGIGAFRPEINVLVGDDFVTANAATLQAALQAAPDQGAGGGYQPGTWATLAETGLLTAAQLVNGTVIARFPYLPAFPANLQPRFVSLFFRVPAGTDFSAGSIDSAIVTTGRDDQANKFAAKNFSVS